MKLNYPRIIPGKFSAEVVGESNYQNDIREVLLYEIMVDKNDTKYKDEKLQAAIILEDDNKFDPKNAVRIDIDGKTVGYLGKEDAASYRKTLLQKGAPSVIYWCDASAYGKRKSARAKMDFGIWIKVTLRDFEIIAEAPPRKKIFGIF